MLMYVQCHVYIINICMCIYVSDLVAQSCLTLSAIPWTVARQAPLSMEFSWQEYWSRFPFPSPIYIYIFVYNEIL